jgi:hypothetical protein
LLDLGQQLSGFFKELILRRHWTTDKIRGSPYRRTEKCSFLRAFSFLIARAALKELRQVKLLGVYPKPPGKATTHLQPQNRHAVAAAQSFDVEFD